MFTLPKDKTILYCNAILCYPYYIVNFTFSLFLDFIWGPIITVGLILLYIIGRHCRSPPRAALWLGTPLHAQFEHNVLSVLEPLVDSIYGLAYIKRLSQYSLTKVKNNLNK